MKAASPGVAGTRVSPAVHGIGVHASDRAECIATIHAALDVLVVVNNDADAGASVTPEGHQLHIQPVSINNNRCYVDHTSNKRPWSTYPYLAWRADCEQSSIDVLST
jgi:hypothetical protein